ncbi:hypothetical protein MARA_02890 (plasmid) [Mycolicibacterium arabiense]|uniref:Uncharacterized protein n=1 Tax=Mycolicibacterium arabiense TaxID=1286181 RepID=A0A7I7RSA0_9MYCO|nr:hypothetical protein [Mycolicibacterium arabiense]MCV7372129.1 hypothetical protein [Mycolicibacterium arabiense]BBY46859.1 hypothetical protein MARA_02890 [Mycolicibacterium arabiense]
MGDLYAPHLPEPARNKTPATRTFVVLTSIASGAIVIASVIGFQLWQKQQPDAAGLASEVLDSMNASLDADDKFRDEGVHAESITVMHITGNMFEGQAELVNDSGKRDSASVHISYDGENLYWRTDPGSFFEVLTD